MSYCEYLHLCVKPFTLESRTSGAIVYRYLLLFLPIWTFAFSPGETRSQTLEQELSGALERHPLINSARFNLREAGDVVDEAFGEFLPEVDLTGDSGYEYTDSPTRRDDDDPPLSTYRNRLSLSLSQNVFDGFERSSRFEIAEIDREAALDDLRSTVQNVFLDGSIAYHDVLRFVRLEKIAVANEQNIREQLLLEDERVERGGGIAVDVLLAKTRLQIAREQRVEIAGLLRDAAIRYREVFAKMPEVERMIEPIPPVELLPQSLEEATEIALSENPQVLAQEKATEAADRQRDIAESDYYPDLNIVLRGNLEDNVAGIDGTRRDVAALLELNWKLFDGFTRPARVRQASDAYSNSLSLLSFEKRQVLEEARLAFNQMETARERVSLLENAVVIAEEVAVARRRLREAGRDTAVNVLDAETESFNAQIEFVNASYDARISVYRLLAALGWLTPSNLDLTNAGNLEAPAYLPSVTIRE